jgi:hypothetical protein
MQLSRKLGVFRYGLHVIDWNCVGGQSVLMVDLLTVEIKAIIGRIDWVRELCVCSGSGARRVE